MKLKYKIEGEIEIDESVYKDEADDKELGWDSMSVPEKVEFVEEVELDCGYESILDHAVSDGKVTIEFITL